MFREIRHNEKNLGLNKTTDKKEGYKQIKPEKMTVKEAESFWLDVFQSMTIMQQASCRV